MDSFHKANFETKPEEEQKNLLRILLETTAGQEVLYEHELKKLSEKHPVVVKFLQKNIEARKHISSLKINLEEIDDELNNFFNHRSYIEYNVYISDDGKMLCSDGFANDDFNIEENIIIINGTPLKRIKKSFDLRKHVNREDFNSDNVYFPIFDNKGNIKSFQKWWLFYNY